MSVQSCSGIATFTTDRLLHVPGPDSPIDMFMSTDRFSIATIVHLVVGVHLVFVGTFPFSRRRIFATLAATANAERVSRVPVEFANRLDLLAS